MTSGDEPITMFSQVCVVEYALSPSAVQTPPAAVVILFAAMDTSPLQDTSSTSNPEPVETVPERPPVPIVVANPSASNVPLVITSAVVFNAAVVTVIVCDAPFIVYFGSASVQV